MEQTHPQQQTPKDPPPLPLYKGGEYNVLLMGHKSVVTTPSHRGEGWGGVRYSLPLWEGWGGGLQGDGKLSHTKRQSADTAITGVSADCAIT